MSRYKRMQTLSTIVEGGLVPVFYEPNIDTAKRIIEALAEGGCNVAEMTNRGDRAWRVFEELEIFCAKEIPQMVLGVGSICDAPTASLYIASGVNFVVGPTFSEDVAKLCNIRKIPYSPGCGSATEIQRAHEFGCEIVKVFPGSSVGGADFVKGVLGPCPWTSIMPTGGVSPTRESLTEWINAGIVAAGIGSKLVTKEMVKSGNFAGLTTQTRDVLAMIQEIRAAKG